MRYKIQSIFLLGMLISSGLSAKGNNWFNPNISLFTGYAIIGNDQTIHSGIFDINNRKTDFGFSLTNRFYVGDYYFFNIGIRYNNFKSETVGLNPFPERFDFPYPFRWVKGYESIVVPIQGGKFFSLLGNRQNCMVYAGVSVGVLMSSNEMVETQYDNPKDPNNHDEISSKMITNSPLPNSFYLTGDIGVDFLPIKKLPNLSIGLLYSLQLNKTSFQEDFTGMIKNVTVNKKYPYNMELRQRFSNLNIVLGYAFKNRTKKLKESENNSLK